MKIQLKKSDACERNKDVILDILKQYIQNKPDRLFEVGSGTGQHAVYFTKYFTNLHWVTSDRKDNLLPLKQKFKKEQIANLHGPETYDVAKDSFPKLKFDYLFTANTFHIMSWKEVKALLKAFKKHLRPGALVFIYGPFKYNGEFTSESNDKFDKSLKASNVKSGIRSFEDVNEIMLKNGFVMKNDHKMPANNQLLVYVRDQTVK